MKEIIVLSLLVLALVLLSACGTVTQSLAPAPAPTFAPDVTVLAAGDIAQCGNASAETIDANRTAQLLDTLPGTLLVLGDEAYDAGTTAQFQNCFDQVWGKFKNRSMPTPGNHEYVTPGAGPYFDYWGELAGPPGKGYYSTTLGAWHIISLNANIPTGYGSPQEQWLRQDLQATHNKCILAFWHQPLFSSGQNGNDPAMHDVWVDLYNSGATLVLNGHDHDYERFMPQDPEGNANPLRGIREFVVGTGGGDLRPFAQIQPNSELRHEGAFGVLKLTLHSTSYSWQFVPVAGETFTDSGNAPCVGRP